MVNLICSPGGFGIYVDRILTCSDWKPEHIIPILRPMDETKQNTAVRGRPPIGKTRMVTVGVRVEPRERERLQELAAQQGLSLCAYLRELIRRDLQAAEGSGLRACS